MKHEVKLLRLATSNSRFTSQETLERQLDMGWTIANTYVPSPGDTTFVLVREKK